MLKLRIIAPDRLVYEGEVDDLPEQVFLNVGTIEEAIEKAKKLQEEMKG